MSQSHGSKRAPLLPQHKTTTVRIQSRRYELHSHISSLRYFFVLVCFFFCSLTFFFFFSVCWTHRVATRRLLRFRCSCRQRREGTYYSSRSVFTYQQTDAHAHARIQDHRIREENISCINFDCVIVIIGLLQVRNARGSQAKDVSRMRHRLQPVNVRLLLSNRI